MVVRSSSAAFLILLISVSCCFAAESGGEGRQAPFVKKASDLRVEGKESIRLDNDRLVTFERGKRKEIPVVLEWLTYKYRLFKILKTETRDVGEKTAFCYEMRAKDPANAYSWQVWSCNVLGEFRLLNSGNGENYLAWADGSLLRFAEVSQPTDRSTRFKQLLGGDAPGVVYIQVIKLIPEERAASAWGMNALYYEILTRSIGKDQDGNWVVRVSPPKSDKVYTFVSDKTAKLAWRRAD